MSLTGNWQCNYHLDNCAAQRDSEEKDRAPEKQIAKMTRIMQLEHSQEGKETKEGAPQGFFPTGFTSLHTPFAFL